MLKIMIIPLLLTGCASVDQFVCYGAGTCGANGQYQTQAGSLVKPIPQTLITNQGTYMVIRDQSSGAISGIIQTSRAK